jgi:hypothetical protein
MAPSLSDTPAMTWKAVWVLGVLGVLGCGSDPPEAAPRPGIEPGSPDRIEVIALDEVTRAPLVGADVTFVGTGGAIGTGTTDVDGLAVLLTDAMVVAVEIASEDHVTERWTASGRHIVVPLQARTVRQTVERTLTGVAEGEQWTVIATSPARVLHANPLEVSIHALCEPGGEGTCTARLEGVAMDGTTSLLAFRTGAGGPDELRVLGTLDQDLLAADRFGTTRIDVSIPDPGAGSTAVVGVPGLGVSGRVAVLPWPVSEGSMIVPDTDSALGTAWMVFTSAADDGGTSVLLQRGSSSVPHWSEWLAPGSLEGLSFTATPETDLVAVAWYGDELLRHDLFVGGAVILEPPAGARRATVRAIDTRSAETGAFDLDASERETARFTDRPLSL